MRTATESAVMLCGVAAVVMALLCVAAVEAKTLPSKLLPGAKPLVIYPGIGSYSIHGEELVTWSKAHRTCVNEGGHLVIVDSEEEAAILYDIMENTIGTWDIHIGLHDSFREGKYESLRGQAMENLGYQTWGDGQPNGGTTQDYCSLKYDRNYTGIYDISNTTEYYFVCELPMWNDYDLIPGMGYYKLHNEPSTWKDSLETCRSEGAYLLLFISNLERDLVVDKYSDALLPSNYVWYGAHHTFTDQLFVTIFDELLDKSGFNSWVYGSNPPNVPNTEYPYVGLNTFRGGDNNLVLAIPTAQLPFICKHDLHDRA